MRVRKKPLAGIMLGLAIAISASPVAAQTANTKTTYTYDALDRVTQVTDPSGLNTRRTNTTACRMKQSSPAPTPA